jgi:hypothetical protein
MSLKVAVSAFDPKRTFADLIPLVRYSAAFKSKSELPLPCAGSAMMSSTRTVGQFIESRRHGNAHGFRVACGDP